MKSFDELADRFESIPDLPVSEELLGAYIEGNHPIYDTLNMNQCEEIPEIALDLDNIIEGITDSGVQSVLDEVIDWLNEESFENGIYVEDFSINSDIFNPVNFIDVFDNHFYFNDDFLDSSDRFDIDLDSIDLNNL